MTKLVFYVAVAFIIMGCKKSDFLNEKPQKSLIIPSKMEHFQAIIDHDGYMNGAGSLGVTPQLGESGSDDFYVLDDYFLSSMSPQTQNYYIWSESPYVGMPVYDWELPYKAVLYANTVLDGINSIQESGESQEDVDNLKGQALFHRAHMFHQLAQVFSPAYNPDTDNSSLSIILRLGSDINESLIRSTVKETYDQIINDLLISISLLDDKAVHKSRPSKQAGYGMLARVYLTMRNYSMAKIYADSCLQVQSELFDYNLADTSRQSPFQGNRFDHPVNQEIIYYSVMQSSLGLGYATNPNGARIDTSLYASFHTNDLRKSVFFQPQAIGYRFKGSYNFVGLQHYFSGLAVDEILLIRAECNARSGNVHGALEDLNRLLFTRFKKDTYVPYESLSGQEALSTILLERRKELIFRGLRWSDLRRLNQEGCNIALTRKINGKEYTLDPKDARWTWPLPSEVINR